MFSHAGGVVPYIMASAFIGVPENRSHIERDRLLVGSLAWLTYLSDKRLVYR